MAEMADRRMALPPTRYAVRRVKGGGGVETYLAEDGATGGGLVVVKHVQADWVPLAKLVRLEHEAAVLVRLGGSSYRQPVDLGLDGDQL